MDRGLYIAASGMLAELARQDQLANDLANASTPGYKADRAAQHSFGQLLVRNMNGEAVGTTATGARLERQVTDLSAAPLRQTDEPLDLAVDGDGYFAVRTSQGVRYTRNGQFTAAANGTLTDQMGNPVLGQNGTPVKINADGTVAAGAVGVFALTNVAKAGDSTFTGTAAGRGRGTVRTGALEESGVDAAHTMVEMMASLRAFEAGQKAITTIDETLDRASGQVGSIR
jgi:flagellar basal-body rod protein FlgG